MTGRREKVQTSYDAIAAEYSDRISSELEGKAFDRALLEEIAARAAGLVCDLGCGPGHVAHYLHQRGAAVVGVDLSPAMIAEGRRRYPGLRFETGDMRSLTHHDGAFAGVVAMYSLIHFDDIQLVAVLREIRRLLSVGGLLLASFHQGSEIVHRDELFGCPVDLDFCFFEPEEITTAVAEAGYVIERVLERDPYPAVEAETRRFYIIAKAGNEA